MEDKEIELLESARINLQNLADMIPGLKDHVMFKVVEQQLTWLSEGTLNG